MKKFLLISIFVLGIVLRFWQLGVNPPSLDWDEAAIGYNAYSILHTGRDEYGSFLPLSFRSFGDYKPPLYVYLTVLSVKVFGLNEFSTRFISAFLGSLSLGVGYFLVKKLFPEELWWKYSLFLFLFAISPWHIQFSRVAFEANCALFFFLSAIYFFLLGFQKPRFLFASALSFALSMYSYHSPRLVIPLFLFILFFLFRSFFTRNWKVTFSVVVFFLFLTFPIVSGIANSTSARFGSVTIFNENEILTAPVQQQNIDKRNGNLFGALMYNRRVIYAKAILGGYLDHFNFDFLFLNGDEAFRHHAAGMGLLYIWEFPFLLLGLIFLFNHRKKYPFVKVLFAWFLIAPISSSLTKATPHAVRSLLYVPTHEIFITVGLILILSKVFLEKKLLRYGFFTIVTFVIFANFYYYLHMYWIHTPIEYAREWQYGYKQMVELVASEEKKYDKVVITYRYDQPYIYFLFYEKINPLWYQKNWGGGEIDRFARHFGKYEFRNLDWAVDSQMRNTLFVAVPSEIPVDVSGIIHTVYLPDGKVAMRIVAR